MSKLPMIVMSLLISLGLLAGQCGSTTTAPPAESQDPTTAEEAIAPVGPVIKVMEPFARASVPNGAVYMHLMNEGDTDDRLISAETNVAETVELHESKMDDNEVMKMSPIDAVVVPAGDSATLKPGGMHIMLMGLNKELATGDTFELTLNFEQTAPQTIEVEVTEGMAMAHGDDHSDHEDHMDEEGGHDHDKIANDGAVISIVSPAPGVEIGAGEMIMVKIDTEGFDLAAEDKHWHLYVDGELVEMVQNGQSEAMLHDLAAGEHTIMTTMANTDHYELEEGAMITIIVR